MNFTRLTTLSSPASGVRRGAARIATLAALATLLIGVQTASTAPASSPSSVITIDPARILDTREPIGVPSVAPVAPDSSITVQVGGVGGVPTNATGVVLTLTAVNATTNTFVTATPTGTPRATTSVLNPSVGGAIANTITVGLGTDGKLDLYNGFGSVDLIADVSGYLLPGGATTPHIEYGAIELTAYNAFAKNAGPAKFDGCVDLGDGGELVLDVPLEHGAAVTNVTFRYYDTDQGNIQFVLYEINDTPTGPNTYGTLGNHQATSNISSGYGELALTPTGADKVSDDVRYYIDVYTPGQVELDTLHWFCGATVEYAREVA
jgi:hypothetical protein